MREIPLTKGKVALVSDEDYERLQRYRWSAIHDKVSDNYYARGVRHNEEGELCTISMHRAVLMAQPGVLVDHINHNGLDNQRENLRQATHNQNMQNRRTNFRKKSGLPKGVFYTNTKKNKFAAIVRKDGVPHRAGIFDNAADASAAYESKSKELFGEFACNL